MASMDLSGTEIKYFKRFSRWKIIVILLALILILAITFAITIGPMRIPPLDAYTIIIKSIPVVGDLIRDGSSSVEKVVVLQVRLPGQFSVHPR